MSEIFTCKHGENVDLAISKAVVAVESKQLIVLPTDTVYGVGVDAFSVTGVAVLLAAKGRSAQMPVPVLISGVSTLDALAVDVSAKARLLVEKFWPGALTIIFRAQPSLSWNLGESRGTVALRVPDNSFTLSLLALTGPLAVSSANRSGRPAALNVGDAYEQLGESVSVYLDQGVCLGSVASTIVDCVGEGLFVVREGAISLEQLQAVVPEVRLVCDS